MGSTSCIGLTLSESGGCLTIDNIAWRSDAAQANPRLRVGNVLEQMNGRCVCGGISALDAEEMLKNAGQTVFLRLQANHHRQHQHQHQLCGTSIQHAKCPPAPAPPAASQQLELELERASASASKRSQQVASSSSSEGSRAGGARARARAGVL
jgi:hypothetical protein